MVRPLFGWSYLTIDFLESLREKILARRRRFALTVRAQVGCRIQFRFYNLVVTGASAEIAGESVAHVGFVRLGVAIEQALRRHQESWRADAALQARVLDEFALQRMQCAAARESLDRPDIAARRFDDQHQAR